MVDRGEGVEGGVGVERDEGDEGVLELLHFKYSFDSKSLSSLSTQDLFRLKISFDSPNKKRP